MEFNLKEKQLLQEIVKKYKQGLISGILQGDNITLTPTGCRNKIISSTGGGGSILSLFANGIEIVTESRTLQPSDASKILILSTGISLYYGTMPNLSTLGIYILDGDNTDFETQTGSLTKGLTGEFVFLIFDSISQSYQMISSCKINDGGLEKTALRYLYDKSQNAIPLTGTEVGKPVTGSIEMSEYNSLYWNFNDYVFRIQHSDEYLQLNAYDNVSSIGLQLNALDKQVEVIAEPTSKGLVGSQYYGANYDDNTYTQKKYVDDKSPSIFGQATLTAGQVTVSNTNIQNTSIIICTANGTTDGGFISVTKNSGVGFTIESSNILDGRTVDYMIKY